MELLWRFAGEDDGATAIEYGLIAALVAVGAIAAMTAFGGSLTGLFGYVNNTAGATLDAAG